MPISVVDHLAGVRSDVGQIRWRDTERVDQWLAVSHPENGAVEVCRQPFVGIERVTVD